MKIVLAGGTYEASYALDNFLTPENDVIVINPDPEYAQRILEQKHVKVTVGDPWRYYVLDAADAYDADIFVGLLESDTDNYASCVMAKRIFNAKKCICTVKNPRNVELYKALGIDSVISSTYLLTENIRNESDSESLIKSLSSDNENIAMIEATLLSNYRICGLSIAEIGFPKFASIAYIVRNYSFVIPNGQVVLKPKDRLVIACAKENEKAVLDFIKETGKGPKTSKKAEEEPKPAEPAPEPTPVKKPAPKKAASAKKGKKPSKGA